MHKGPFCLSRICGYLTIERFQLKGLLQACSPTSCSKHRQLQASLMLLCSTGVELSAGNPVRLENAPPLAPCPSAASLLWGGFVFLHTEVRFPFLELVSVPPLPFTVGFWEVWFYNLCNPHLPAPSSRAIKPFLSHLFSMLNEPGSLSLALCAVCASSLVILMASAGLSPVQSV